MDWDLDGKLDILSGCYWTEGAEAGQIQILMGNGGLDFAESVSLQNAEGEPLENRKLAEGDDRFQIETICTQQHAVDYDGDGDLDLVVGCFGSSFYYYENTAKPGEKAALTSPVKLDLSSPHQHAAPHLVDWDKDGDLDFLTGTSSGGVLLSENVGSRTEPKYKGFTELVKPHNGYPGSSDSGAPTISASTRVWATDYNGDGLLDLLVGDSSSITRRVPGLSDAEYDKLKTEFNEKTTAASAKMQKFQTEHPEEFEAMNRGEEADPEFQKKMEALYEEMGEAYGLQEKFQTTQSTGYVWLLIRKPTADSLAAK